MAKRFFTAVLLIATGFSVFAATPANANVSSCASCYNWTTAPAAPAAPTPDPPATTDPVTPIVEETPIEDPQPIVEDVRDDVIQPPIGTDTPTSPPPAPGNENTFPGNAGESAAPPVGEEASQNTGASDTAAPVSEETSSPAPAVTEASANAGVLNNVQPLAVEPITEPAPSTTPVEAPTPVEVAPIELPQPQIVPSRPVTPITQLTAVIEGQTRLFTSIPAPVQQLLPTTTPSGSSSVPTLALVAAAAIASLIGAGFAFSSSGITFEQTAQAPLVEDLPLETTAPSSLSTSDVDEMFNDITFALGMDQVEERTATHI